VDGAAALLAPISDQLAPSIRILVLQVVAIARCAWAGSVSAARAWAALAATYLLRRSPTLTGIGCAPPAQPGSRSVCASAAANWRWACRFD